MCVVYFLPGMKTVNHCTCDSKDNVIADRLKMWIFEEL